MLVVVASDRLVDWRGGLLLAGGLIDEIGFRIRQIAVPLVVVSATGDVALAGLVGGAVGIPTLLAPWWGRRLRQRLVASWQLAGLLVLEGIGLLLVPVAVGLDAVEAAVLVASGLVSGAASALQMPGRSALLADLGDRKRSGGAAEMLAWDDVQTRIGLTVGPLLAAVAMASGQLRGVFAAVAASLLAGALTAAASASGDPASERVAPTVRQSVHGHPAIVRGWLIRGTGCLGWFAFSLGLPLLGGAGLAAVGFTAYGLGGLVAASVMARVVRTSRPLAWAAGGWLLCGAAFAAIGLWPTRLLIAVAAFAAGVLTPLGNACVSAVVTRSTTGPARRAALAGQRTLVTATSTLGLIVGGPLLAAIGVRAGLVVVGAMIGAAAIVGRTRTASVPSSPHQSTCR